MEDFPLYIEINVFCVAFLAVLAVLARRGVSREREQKLFSNLCLCASLMFVWDVLWKIFDGAQFTFAHQLLLLLNGLFFAQSGILAYLWFRYALFVDDPSKVNNRLSNFLMALPMVLLVVTSFASIKTQWLFVVNEVNAYSRGFLLPFQFVIVTAYMALGILTAHSRSRQRKNYVRRSKLKSIALASILPFLGWIFQLDNPGMPLSCCGITFSLTIIFVEELNGMISLDPLTRLNNKVQLHRFLEERMYSFSRNNQLVFFMLDLNNFRHINDSCGSAEGDRALLVAANVIKAEFGPMGFFIARYSGDTFAVVAELENIEDCVSLVAGLNRRLEEKSRNLKYKLSMSIGYGRFIEGDDIQGLEERAVNALKAVKKARLSKG